MLVGVRRNNCGRTFSSFFSSTLPVPCVSTSTDIGPATTKLPGGLTRKSDAFSGFQPFGSADSTAVEIISLIRPGVYFLPLRLCALCCVVSLFLVLLFGLLLLLCL